MRRSPGWLAESTAWAAALVLVAALGVVVTGVIKSQPSQAETPVVSAPRVAPTYFPSKRPPRPTPTVVTRAVPGVPNEEAALGKPPGPQRDLVPTRFAAPADRYAFLAGVTNYRAPTKDTIAGANDVVFIRSLLISSGWLPQNIKIVTDKQATGAALRSGLTWLAGKSVPGTFTLFHFSGHVKQAGGHEKLWPYDRDFVLDTEMAAILKRGTGKMWVDIAGCEAGGFMEPGLASARVLVSASSKATQKSYEYPNWGESVWTGLLWDLGLGQGQADADSSGMTTVGEALRYATYYSQAITLHQRPYGRQTPQVAGDPVRGWNLENPPA